jgi:hypothetical protein
MITSEVIKLKLNKPITNEQIETTLNELNLNVLRWAITEVNDDVFTIRAAIIK